MGKEFLSCQFSFLPKSFTHHVVSLGKQNVQVVKLNFIPLWMYPKKREDSNRLHFNET